MRRYLALFFPRWPVQHLRQRLPELRKAPVVFFERSQRGNHLRVCSGEANTLGIRSGMSVVEAKALAPQLLLHELNLSECDAALKALCLWTTRFSPLAMLEGVGPHAPFPQSLLLDITGCEDVFGGEDELLALAVQSLKKMGYKVRAAIASTLGAAWALAHFGPLASVAPQDATSLKEVLASIPLAGLRLSTEMLADFRPLGLYRIGDILRQPRASLPSRFGKELTARIDQIFGVVPEPVVPLRPAPEFRVARAFEYPIRSSEILFQILEQLIERLASEMKNAQRGVRHIECWLYHEIATPVCAEIALHRCSNSRKHLWQLLRARLEDLFRTPAGTTRKFRNKSVHAKKGLSIEVDESIEAVAIHVTASESLSEQQLPLFERAKEDAARGGLNLLLDRLVTRMGPAAVSRIRLEDDPLPERAFRLVALDEDVCSAANFEKSVNAPRPLRLFPHPLPAQVNFPGTVSCEDWQQAIRSLVGPERIESGWWREGDQRRDYYVVEVESGARHWIFQDLLEKRWFLHGSFD